MTCSDMSRPFLGIYFNTWYFFESVFLFAAGFQFRLSLDLSASSRHLSSPPPLSEKLKWVRPLSPLMCRVEFVLGHFRVRFIQSSFNFLRYFWCFYLPEGWPLHVWDPLPWNPKKYTIKSLNNKIFEGRTRGDRNSPTKSCPIQRNCSLPEKGLKYHCANRQYLWNIHIFNV